MNAKTASKAKHQLYWTSLWFLGGLVTFFFCGSGVPPSWPAVTCGSTLGILAAIVVRSYSGLIAILGMSTLLGLAAAVVDQGEPGNLRSALIGAAVSFVGATTADRLTARYGVAVRLFATVLACYFVFTLLIAFAMANELAKPTGELSVDVLWQSLLVALQSLKNGTIGAFIVACIGGMRAASQLANE